MAAPLPNPKRYVTTNNKETGTSTFSEIMPVELPVVRDSGKQHARLAWSSARAPVKLDDDTDILAHKSLVDAQVGPPNLVTAGGGGSTSVWYGDTAPGADGPMHNTGSVDFVVVIQGEIELILGDGSRRLLGPGDMVVQRETMHQWRNPSQTTWARVMGVVIDNRPLE